MATKVRHSHEKGFGLALLLIFVLTTVGIAVSVQMAQGTASSATTISSRNKASASLVAKAALPVVQADIKFKLNSGASVSTAYSLSGNISVPNDPTSLTGPRSTVGTFQAAIVAARSDYFLIRIVASVDGSTFVYTELCTISATTTVLDIVPNAAAAYSMRRLRSAYTGPLVRVKRNSDGAEQNVGFTSNGELDTSSLLSFVGTYSASPPLDSAGTPLVAYSLRKMRTAYGGSAIRVRRTPDNAEQDIGFDASGNLNQAALLSFVGSGSGYVSTWYDQGANALHATQATAGSQPLIVYAGNMLLLNGRPTVFFSNNSLVTAASALFPSSTAARTMNIVAQTNRGGWYAGYAWGSTTGGGYPASGLMLGTLVGIHVYGPGDTGASIASDIMPHIVSVTYDGSTVNSYLDTVSILNATGKTFNTAANTSFQIGRTVDGHDMTGYESEIVIYDTVNSGNRSALENNQKAYYQSGLGYVTTWFDQSGNGLDATQTVAMPLIVSAGRIHTIGGKPAILFDGAANTLDTAASALLPSGNAAKSINLVEQSFAPSWYGALSWGNATTNGGSEIVVGGTIGYHGYYADSDISVTPNANFHIPTFIFTGSNLTTYYDTTQIGSWSRSMNTTSNTALRIGRAVGNDRTMNGLESEILIYPRAITAQERQMLEGNQTVYY